MTEAEWLACGDPLPLLQHLRGQVEERKLRLLAVACCRRKSKYFADRRCQPAVDTAEAYADDESRIGDLGRVMHDSGAAFREWRAKQGSIGQMVRITAALTALVRYRRFFVDAILLDLQRVPVDSERARAEEAGKQSGLLRDIFGNPFRPVAVDPRWRTETVVALAAGVYADRAFDRMPILADALEDAGCDSADILAHCRGDGPHVRGCWVVDLILGKE